MKELAGLQRGFTIYYRRVVRSLETAVGVGLPFDHKAGETSSFSLDDYTALWDTGATTSCIRNGLAHFLNLPVIRSTTVMGVDGPYLAKVYLASVTLPNHVVISEIELLGCDDSLDAAMLIGMDVISQGDFLVSTFNGETTFSFQMPAKEPLDLMRLQYAETDLKKT